MIIRIVALNDFRIKVHVIDEPAGFLVGRDLECRPALVEVDLHLFAFVEEASEFADCLGRKNNRSGAGRRDIHFFGDQGETATVGCDKGKFTILKVEINAVEDVTRFIGGLRVGDTLEHGDKLRLIEGVGLFVAKLGKRGKFFLADAHNAKCRPAGREFDLVVGRTIKGDVHVGQFPHDTGQTFDGEGHRARFLYLGLNFAANAQIEVSGGERNLILFRLDEDIA